MIKKPGNNKKSSFYYMNSKNYFQGKKNKVNAGEGY